MNIGYNDRRELEELITVHRKGLLREYGKYLPESILEDYLPQEQSLIVNDDPDMYPVELLIPEAPPLHTIDGFGLKHQDQYFRPQKMPYKLKELVRSSKTTNDVWEKLNLKKKDFRDEIMWIQKMWTYRLYGYWFYNDGVPTYIDGSHFYYLNVWNLDCGLPSYRLRDRVFFMFAKYCFTTTEAPFFYKIMQDENPYYFSSQKTADIYIAQHGLNMTAEKGFWMIDYGRRTCYGFNYPKHRREGATYKACALNVEMVSMRQQQRGTILSKDGSSALTAFKVKMINPIKKIPFYYLPQTENMNSSEEISFDTITERSGRAGTVIQDTTGLMSAVFPTTSSDERKADGDKFLFVHGDEVGKTNKARQYNLIKRHDVMKKTVAQFPNIHGLMVNTSTSDDTKGEAGRRYMELCKKSHWHERDYITGFTESGLFNLFMPTSINLDGYSDKYGNPIINTPTEEQKKFIGNVAFGAKTLIESSLLQKINDPETYYNERREAPMSFRDCFLTSGEDSGFDVMLLVKRISELDMNSSLSPRTGNLEWTNGWGSSVEFIDKSDGRFEISYYPDRPNASVMINGKLVPANTHKFVSACDPFKFDVNRSKRQSKGAGIVYLKRDSIIDPDDKETSSWETERVCCSYNHKVSTDAFNEDMLKMCVFYGCEIFPEMNEEIVYRFIKNTKYKHYLGYLYINGMKEKLPGFYTQTVKKELMFQLIKVHIERNVLHEKHKALLQQLSEIGNISELKDFDLIAAFGGCLLANYYKKAVLSDGENQLTDSSIVAYIERMQRR